MKKSRYVKPVAEILLFDLAEVRMLELISSNDGEDAAFGDNNGDNNGNA